MGKGHDQAPGAIQYEKPLWWAFGLTSTFMIAEVVGGLWTNSLALISDATHMMTDVIALGISLTVVRLSRRPADAKRTYGYARLEALGAMVNGGLLFVVAGYILWEAWGRFREPPEVASIAMLVIATLGLIVNLISMRLLKAGAGESLNVKGAYLEVWSDMLGSVGVILGAVVIYFTGWAMADPIIAVVIGLWVLPRAWMLMRQAGHILMQGVPRYLDLDAIRVAIQGQRGVRELHDLHVWELGSNQVVLTAHVVLDEGDSDAQRARTALMEILDEKFHIEHVTLQIETEPCGIPPHS